MKRKCVITIEGEDGSSEVTTRIVFEPPATNDVPPSGWVTLTEQVLDALSPDAVADEGAAGH